MGHVEQYGSAAVVGVLGLLAVSVPAFDMGQDVFAEGKPPVTTLIENSPLVLLGVAIIGVAVWLAFSEWESAYVRTVAKLATLHSLGVALLVTLVVSVQLHLQGDLKPFIIAADAVVIGILGGLILGIRTAQQERATDEAATQRDRFQALFDNVPNPIVGVEFVGDVPIVRAVNPAFTEVFGSDRRTIVGDSLTEYIVPADEELDPVDRPLSPQDRDETDVWDSDVIELETVDGRREFIRLTAPVERGPERDGYAIYIDVTAQQQRRERLRVLSRTLRHDIRNKLTVILGLRDVSERLDGKERELTELATDAAAELQTMSEQTRRIERRIAGERESAPRDLHAIVTEAVGEIESEHPDLAVSVTAPETAYGNVTEAFYTAVREIIENAVVHNDADHPEIDITIAESVAGDYVDIRIADNGPGIDAEAARIAEGQLETHQTMHLDGLGLWTVRWVLQNSGGGLDFSLNSPRGTIVTIQVPAAEAVPDGSEPDSDRGGM